MYQVKRPFSCELVPIRTLKYHVRQWGTPKKDHPSLLMVHGWMDVGASYQFVVDALKQDRHVIAPDWRGFGLTDSGGADQFWFPDYLADLDALIDHFHSHAPIDLVGHSMGGNVVMMYAGIRPERVRRLINLEGFGLAQSKPSQAPKRYADWMDQTKKLHRGEFNLKTYLTVEAVAQRLMKTNPRLSLDKAQWLAQHWAQVDDKGEWRILGEAAHKVTSANIYRLEEVLACFERITAPTLSVHASDDSMSKWWSESYSLKEYLERIERVPNISSHQLKDCGHMLHHDQPIALAQLIEDFLSPTP